MWAGQRDVQGEAESAGSDQPGEEKEKILWVRAAALWEVIEKVVQMLLESAQ